jgi:transcriptional regulator with XRE-family HTH domain
MQRLLRNWGETVAWLLIKGALRRLRNKRKMEMADLAKRSGLAERTLWLYESRTPPKSIHADSVKRLALALECEREELARWEAFRQLDAPDDQAIDSTGLPRVGTLFRRAEEERQFGGSNAITTGSGTYDLLGPVVLRRCFSACAVHQDQKFAVAGLITDHDYLPEVAAKKLGAKIGAGARFRMERKITKALPVYATVFTRDVNHTRHLMDHADSKKMATVIVRVVVEPPEKDWKGFFIFEKTHRPRPFAFVVEEVAALESRPPGASRK